MRLSAPICVALALTAQALAAPPKVIAVDVDGIVHPVTAEIVAGAIAQARAEHAAALLIRLNTPGGLMDAMRETIEEMIAAPVPVVTYVAPSGGRAASAGFFLLEAGDVAAMAPGTNTGAAHPVAYGRRNGRRHEGKGGERCRGLSASHRFQARAQQRTGRNGRPGKPVVHRARGAGPASDRSGRRQRQRSDGRARRPHGDALRRHVRRRCTWPAPKSKSTRPLCARK